MKLQEQLNRIQSMMGTINESKLQKQFQDEIDSVGFISFMNQSKLSIEEITNVLKIKPIELIKEYLDDIFNNLTIERIYPNEPKLIVYQWFDDDGNKVFEKNHWGMFFIKEFSFIKPIKSLEYEKTLIDYLNTRYEEEFDTQPIREIDKSFRFFEDDDW